MIPILRDFVSAFAGLTLAYWAAILIALPQFAVPLLGCAGVAALIVTSRRGAQGNNTSQSVEYILGSLGLAVAIFVSCLYAYNPDDGTFFHRAAHSLSSWATSIPIYETRLAFDHLPPISAAHLITSWEYVLAALGQLLGEPVLGYQIGGTLVSILFYVAACHFTLRHFVPNAGATLQVVTVLLVLTILFFFDADRNLRIGSWLFLGGWTGKCFLAAALIILFPAVDRAATTGTPKDWVLVYCLIIFYLGLSGSALFILPIGLALSFTAIVFHRRVPLASLAPAAIALAVPLLVGGLFIYHFGGLRDDSYWRSWSTTMPFLDYVRLTIANRHLWLYVGLLVVVLRGAGQLGPDSMALNGFALYQLLLALVLFNPWLVAVLQRIMPPDGFWRTYYLLQYPTLLIILIPTIWNALSKRAFFIAGTLGVALLASLYGGGNVFSLQTAWGYPQHFVRLGQPKLELIEAHSVQDAATACPTIRNNGALLAPERWEVAAQMIFPGVTTVSARHMHHNFLNAPLNSVSLSEAVRRGATDYVSADNSGNPKDFGVVISKNIDAVIFQEEARRHADSLPRDLYRLVSSTGRYVVYCRRNPEESGAPK